MDYKSRGMNIKRKRTSEKIEPTGIELIRIEPTRIKYIRIKFKVVGK